MVDETVVKHQSPVGAPMRKLEISQSNVTHAKFSTLELLALFLFAVVVMASRMPDRLAHGFLWAEDGLIFTEQGYRQGINAIFQPYAGYLHVLPRLIVWLYSHIGNPEAVPKAFAYIAAGLSAAAVTYIGAVAVRYLPRIAAFAIALTPLVTLNTGEVWLSVTNLQWVLAPVLAVMLWEMVAGDMHVQQSSGASFLKSLAFVILMMTGPFGVVLGVFAIGAIVLRTFSTRTFTSKAWAPFIVGFVVQASVLVFCPARYKIPAAHTITDFAGFRWIRELLRFILVDFVGAPNGVASWPRVWVIFAVGVVAAMFVCVVFAGKRWRATAIVLLVVSLLMWVLGIIRTDNPQMNVEVMMRGNRYSYEPFIFASWALIIGAATTSSMWIRTIALIVVAAALLNSVTSWRCEQIAVAKVERTGEGVYFVHMPPSDSWNFTFKTR